MARIAYETWNPGSDALDTIRKAEAICRDYRSQGYDLTLRQLYYQFVARGWIENTQRSYKRLGDVVNKARMAGLLDWDYIVDRTRNLASQSHWTSPARIIQSAAAGFALDKWADQPARVEVWVEKEALAGVIAQVAERHDVDWFACRGYVSQSELWAAGQRLRTYIERGQRVVVLHLGDHDPSGIDMSRDIEDRLRLFISRDYLNGHAEEFEGDSVSTRVLWDAMANHCAESSPDGSFVPALEVRRIALNEDQVEEYDPPPNPAKLTDSRSAGYCSRYGDQSWELDALDPSTLDALIESHVLGERDDDLWDDVSHEEETHRRLLRRAADRWDEVVDLLEPAS